MDFGTPWDLENRALAYEGLKFSLFDASQKCHQKTLHLGSHFEVFWTKNSQLHPSRAQIAPQALQVC